jgi:tetratricopeptide (TPR) repeat protein
LRGDLDWIVLMAIEKDRERRYGSPSQLADDLRRHLRNEPVVARPPSTLYRAGRFERRHKVIVGAGAIAFAGLVAAVVGTAIGMIEANREAETANRVTQFLVELLEVTDPRNARGENVTAREVLDRGAERVRTELQSEPLVQARLAQTIGEVYDALGLYDRAEPLHQSALATLTREVGPDDPRTLSAMGAVAIAQWRLGRYDEAQPKLERLLAIRRERLGDEDPDTLKTTNDLALDRVCSGHQLVVLEIVSLRSAVLVGDFHLGVGIDVSLPFGAGGCIHTNELDGFDIWTCGHRMGDSSDA